MFSCIRRELSLDVMNSCCPPNTAAWARGGTIGPGVQGRSAAPSYAAGAGASKTTAIGQSARATARAAYEPTLRRSATDER